MREQPRCKILICDLRFEKHGGPSFADIFTDAPSQWNVA